MKFRLFNFRLIATGIIAVLGSATVLGAVTFSDLAGTANNTPLSASYNTGLPSGVTATWNIWLLHDRSSSSAMSVFVEADLAGNDAEIIFSEPIIISSISIYDTSWGSSFALIGYFEGTEVWRFDSSTEGVWQTITSGANIEIDTMVAEGKWNHIDDIVIKHPSEVLQPGEVMLSLAPNPTSNEIELSWPGILGSQDQLQSTAELTTNTMWQDEGALLLGLGATNTIAVGVATNTAKFYRLKSDMLPTDEINAEVGIATNGLPVPPAGFVWAPIPAYSDEFNGSTLDPSKWINYHPYWSGRAPSRHLPANVSVGGGKLRLKNSVIQDPSTVANPSSDVWVGAACVTSKDQTAYFGYYEAKIKASTLCMTSAFWFQSKGSPATEIDVVEQLGISYNNPYKEFDMQSNSHYVIGGDWNGPNHFKTPTHWTMPTRARAEYHVYGVWWIDMNTIWLYHNGQKVGEMTPGGDFNVGQYMFFDTEVFHWEGLPTVTNLNNDNLNTMYVDWVRGWQLVPE